MVCTMIDLTAGKDPWREHSEPQLLDVACLPAERPAVPSVKPFDVRLNICATVILSEARLNWRVSSKVYWRQANVFVARGTLVSQVYNAVFCHTIHRGGYDPSSLDMTSLQVSNQVREGNSASGPSRTAAISLKTVGPVHGMCRIIAKLVSTCPPMSPSRMQYATSLTLALPVIPSFTLRTITITNINELCYSSFIVQTSLVYSTSELVCD